MQRSGRFLCLLTALSFASLAGVSVEAEKIFEDDWSSGYWDADDHKAHSGGSGWQGVNWKYSQMQSNAAGLAVSTLEGGYAPRKGSHAMQFTWYRNQYDPSDSNNSSKAHLWTDWEYLTNTDRWYGFSTFLPSGAGGMADDSEWEILVQWHGRPSTPTEPHRIPPAAILHKDNRLVFKWYYDRNWISTTSSQVLGGQVEIGPADKNVWIDWLIRIKWSRNNDGIIEINRKNIAPGRTWERQYQEYNASIGYYDMSDPQLGIGIYKYDAAKRYNQHGNTNHGSDHYRRRVYFDEVTIATTANEAKP
ncbi:MAG: heparin lyase I family protein [Planctomycetota bacterium]